MSSYRLAGQDFCFAEAVPELASFKTARDGSVFKQLSPQKESVVMLSCQTQGWVGGEWRDVQSWFAPPGVLLKVAGGSDFYLAPGGQTIARVADGSSMMTDLDREILVGPALVLALTMCGTWCLHASAILHGERALLFLGESGQGKSTLAAYLASAGGSEGQLVADDILPVTTGMQGLDVWPHFPQLKLPSDSQPGSLLPETIPAGWICVLSDTGLASDPDLEPLSPGDAIQSLLRHTAGTRLLERELLSKHLEFCALAVSRIPFYQLSYPHRRDALPKIKEILKTLY